LDLTQNAADTQAAAPDPPEDMGEPLALEPLTPLSERSTTSVEELAPPAAAPADLDALSESLTPLEPLEAPQSTTPKQPERNVVRGIDVIVINPGHGGNDTGCVGQSGLRESDLTLAVARRVQEAIARETGVKAILTREGDQFISHRQRANLANSGKGDLFISIHTGGGYAPDAHGCEVFCSSPATNGAAANAAAAYADRSLAVAQRVAPALAKATEAADRGVRAIPCQLLKDVSMPGVLVEVGFLTNLSEESLLQGEAYQEKIAQGIAAGIRDYLGGAAGGEQ
jgi:N-acetylmuramoyl-L-alanine amidase